VWAMLCAAAAGVVLSLVHTWFFSYRPSRAALLHTLANDIVAALAIAAGQGAVALVSGGVLARLGRQLQGTALLGLLVGAVDFVLNFVQMVVPVTELGWAPDIVILAGVTGVITLLGSRRALATT